MSDEQHDTAAALKAKLWRAGKLRYKLHSSQKEVYDKYREWETYALAERKAERVMPGLYPRIFQFDVSRRWGKDFLSLLIRIEDAIRKPGSHYIYATCYGKDISGIVIPLFHQLCEDCPLDVKPEYKQSFQGTEAGLYFKNGSIIRLVGIDRNPDGMRGRHCDGATISEAGFVDRLEYALLSVISPMLMGKSDWRLGATIIINSTPPDTPGTWYDTHLTEDCRNNGRHVLRTIDDNPLIGPAQREEHINSLGGRDSDRCKREFYCVRLRSEDLVVIPEFNRSKHVRTDKTPRFARGFTVIDPGVRDLCGVICGYLDFERAKMVVKRSWAKRGANTLEVAEAIKALEAEVFKDLKHWNGRGLAPNPAQRWSDTEARMILDLSTLHKLTFAAADKQDREAALNALRVAVKLDKIEVDPAAKDLVLHLENAVWNNARTSYARSDVYGHFDLVDCLLYAWRMASPSAHINPTPPAGHLHIMAGGQPGNVLWRAVDWQHPNTLREKIASIWPGSKSRKSHTSSR